MKKRILKAAESTLSNGFSFSMTNYDTLIGRWENEGRLDGEIPSWDEVVEELTNEGYYYCDWEDAIVGKEYAIELGIFEEED